MKEKIVAIVGPTATGKSSLAVRIAKKYGGEIISTDSRQVYRGLDYSTGKIPESEMRGIPHHLLDVLHPSETMSAAMFKRLAQEKISEIISREKLPILCGGTGLYVDAVLYDFEFPEVPPNEALRKELEQKELPELIKDLEQLDPARAQTVDRENKRRVVRAVEIVHALGEVPPLSTKSNYSSLIIGLTPDDDHEMRIRDSINERLESGMLSEVEEAYKTLSPERFEELGFNFTLSIHHIQDDISREELVEKLLQHDKKYTKKQMRWLKRNKEIVWVKGSEEEQIMQHVSAFIAAS